ncbi:MAG: phenylalanine--tRNA ligase subunit beta [Granulosicoccus sp.]|nr:phenylalanine--tRNA ligase subunit beta [Granulosicoccus sp.]
MKLSEKWLREWIDPPVDTAGLSAQLTAMGLEVDEVVSAAPEFAGVVVARILGIRPHPDADRLRVCDVDCGADEPLQVVCGAPNARAGLVTVLAQVGGRLPDGTVLKKAKLRGQVSMGMLCSGAELGLSDDASGIMELPEDAPAGLDLIQYMALDDSIIDIELTPDRGDCLSVRGIARDLSARNDLPLLRHEAASVPTRMVRQWPVRVEKDTACVRYTGRLVSQLSLDRASPAWMVERLRRAGVRAINPVVDVTNYVMLELGQPMHAFDADKLRGSILVRQATAGEQLVLLDGREMTLDQDTTVIADERGAIGIAGIMGGESTAVDQRTVNIFFESALFLPERIAGKPRRYASHSESAHRFERGVDPAGQVEALEYATELLLGIAGGQAGPVGDWQDSARLPQRGTVLVRRSRLMRILGIDPDVQSVSTLFTRLGISTVAVDDGWQVVAPSYRYDLAIEEDYIEEVARILGYDAIPRTSPVHRPVLRPVPENRLPSMASKRLLAQRGYQEVITYSFVDESRQSVLRPDLPALKLANPISSELAVMRTTLVGGLITTLQRNLARQSTSMSLFETGLRFLANESGQPVASLDSCIAADHGGDLQSDPGVQQQNMIAGLVAGRRQPENWNASAQEADFYTIKSDIESLFSQANELPVTYVPVQLALLHPGQRAGILLDGKPVGYVGALNPSLQQALDLPLLPFVFELSLAALSGSRVPRAIPMSRFPQVRRDIALLVDEAVSYQAIVDVIRAQAPAMLQDIRLFDVYQGDKLPEGKKSMALGLILQEFSRTLEDSEVDQVITAIVAALEVAHGAVLRI